MDHVAAGARPGRGAVHGRCRVSIVVVGVVVHLLLGLDWRPSLLYGAVLSSTDAAAVFATLRRLRLPPRLVAALEAESG
ncbi:cation:proton antiporter [Micromonospora sp. BRA006-A]|nr:cation:proton antiporter [Micromonospora sp. BRA006-A]